MIYKPFWLIVAGNVFLANLVFGQQQTSVKKIPIDAKWSFGQDIIEYELPSPSYVLLRIGKEKGPMYKTLLNWDAQERGSHKLKIDIEDKSLKEKLIFSENLKINLLAYPILSDNNKPSLAKDTELILDTNCVKEEGKLIVNSDCNISIDFSKNSVWKNYKKLHLKVCLDDRKIIEKRIKKIPYKFELKENTLGGLGYHILTVNIWDFKENYAYNSVGLEYENSVGYQKRIDSIKAPKIAFIKTSEDGYYQIYIAEISNVKSAYQITFDDIDKRTCEISSDGRKILYTTNKGKIYILALDNIKDCREVQLETQNCSEAKWAKNDTCIIFTSYADVRTDDSDIWLYNLDDKKITKLTNMAWLQNDPVLTDNGETMYFINGPELNKYELYRMDLKNQVPIQMTQSHCYVIGPSISPSGKNIAFSANINGWYNIWITDIYGQEYKEIGAGNTDSISNTLPKWNGDSEIIYLSKTKDEKGTRIMSVNIGTREEKAIIDLEKEIIWFSIL